MNTGGQVDSPDLLVSWKDIAAYLKCSVRKAQRLEKLKFPVNRISGTKSVWALKSEIDAWMTSQAEIAKRGQDPWTGRTPQDESRSNVLISGNTKTSPVQGSVVRTRSRLSLWLLGTALGISLGLAVIAALTSAYALAILFFVVTDVLVVLVYPSLPDTSYTRAVVGLFVIAGISYTASATTLPDVIDSVVNMRTLRPALAYPFVTGLRFIPIPVLISMLLVVLTYRDDMDFARSPRLRTAYLFLGILFLFMTVMVSLSVSGAHRIWQAGQSIRWTLLAGESFVFAVNLALFVLAYRSFNNASTKNYRQLLSWCGTGCLLIALTAAIVGRHWNEINKHHLDIRRPHAYRVKNADAANQLRDWLQRHSAEVGPDLISLSDDPEFLLALQTGEFYKQDFDEAFQLTRKAVIFGYKSGPDSRGKPPGFVLIRFPADLAAALRLQVTQ